MTLQPVLANAETGFFYRYGPAGGKQGDHVEVVGPATVYAHVGSRVTATYFGSGGTPPYAWSASKLPDTLTISDGLLSGTPTAPGLFHGFVGLVDGAAETASAPVDVQVYGILKLLGVADFTANVGAPVRTKAPTLTGDPVAPVLYELATGTLPPGMSLDPATGVVTGTSGIPVRQTVTLKATDATGADAISASFTITVAPTLAVTAPTPTVARVGRAWTLGTPSIAGTYSNPVSWSLAHGTLPDGLSLTTRGTVSGTPTTAGTFADVSIAATDAKGRVGNTAAFPIEVRPRLSFASVADQTYRVGATVSLPVTGLTKTPPPAPVPSGGPLAPVAWSLASGALPPGLALDRPSGLLVGTPTTAGDYPLALAVTDATGGSAATPTLVAHVLPPFTIAHLDPVSVATRTAVGSTPPATLGSPKAPVTWTVSPPLPAGFTLGADGSISGQADLATAVTETLTAVDGDGFSATSNGFPFSVVGAFVIDAYGPISGRQGVAATYPAQHLTGTVAAPVTWSVASPASIDATTGVVTFAPPAAGENTVVVTALDAAGNAAQTPLLVVASAAPSIAYDPASGTGLVPTADKGGATTHVNLAVSDPVVVTGAAVRPYAFAVTAGALPAGLTLDPATGLVSGSTRSVGPSDATVTMTDAAGSTATAHVLVTSVGPLTAKAAADSDGRVGLPLAAAAPTATNVVGAPTWSVAAGSDYPPAGTYLADDGSFAGTPQAPGFADVTLTVVDATGASATTPTPSGVGVLPPLAFETVRPIVGRTGVSLSEAAPAVDNQPSPPVAYSPFSQLPPGLGMDGGTGTVSGVPTAVGSWTTAFVAKDVTGATATSAAVPVTITSGVPLARAPDVVARVGARLSANPPALLASNPAAVTPLRWALGTPVAGLAIDPATGVVSGVATGPAGHVAESFLVTDAGGATGASAFDLSVQAPLAFATIPDQAWRVARPFSLDPGALANGPVGTVAWSATGLPAGLSADPATGVVSGSPLDATPDAKPAAVTLGAVDGNGDPASQSFHMTVYGPLAFSSAHDVGQRAGRAITAPPPPTTTPLVGNPFWTLATGSLPDGVTVDPATGTISGTLPEIASYPVSLSVTDGTGASATSPTFKVVAQDSFDVVDAATPLMAAHVGGALARPAPTVDGLPHGKRTWALSDGALPAGVAVDPATGAISGTATSPSDSASVAVGMTDDNGASASVTPYPVVVTPPLAFAAGKDVTLRIDQPTSLDAPALSGANRLAPPTFVLAANATIPQGTSIDPVTGALVGTPSSPGTYSVSVTATDAAGGLATSAPVAVTVPPHFTATAPASLETRVGRTFASGAPAIVGEARAPVTWTVTQGSLGPDVKLDPKTGALAGSPKAVGDLGAALTATDALGDHADLPLTVHVYDVLAFATPTTPIVTQVGQPATFPAQALTTPLVGKATWSVATGTLPGSLKVDPATGVVSGEVDPLGSTTVTFSVGDATGAVATSGAVKVTAQDVFSIADAATPLMAAHVGGALSRPAPLVTGFPFGIRRFALASGALPQGVSIDAATGAISGVATATADSAAVAVKLSDGYAVSASTNPAYPVVVTAPLALAGRADAPGRVGQDLDLAPGALTGANRLAPPAYAAVDPSQIPPGTAYDPGTGHLRGQPTGPGAFKPALSVTDAAGGAASTAPFSLTVLPALVATPPATLVGRVGRPFASGLPALANSPANPVKWTITGGSIAQGVRLDQATGAVAGTPTAPDEEGAVLTATDSAGASASVSVPFQFHDVLAFAATPDMVAQIGVASTFATPALTAPLGGNPRWSLASGTLPGTFALDPATGVVSGGANVLGSATITVSVTDDTGAVATTKPFHLVVQDVYSLADTGTGALAAHVGIALSRTAPTVTGAPFGATRFSLGAGALPAGVAVDPATGAIAGTATGVVDSAVTVALSDAAGASYATAPAVPVVVTPPLTFATRPAASLRVGLAARTAAPALSGANRLTPPAFAAVDATALPPGTSVDPATGDLVGTPTAVGTFSVAVGASDAAGGAATAAPYAVTVRPALVATAPANLSGRAGRAFSSGAPGLSNAPVGQVAWTLGGGTLAPGLSLSKDTGVASGTPTDGDSDAATLVATDAEGATASVAVPFVILAHLAIADEVDPTVAHVGSALVVAGPAVTPSPVTPLHFAANPALPAGLSLDAATGAISGTPTAAVDVTTSLSVTDSAGDAATGKPFTIHVTPALQVSTPGGYGRLGVGHAQVAPATASTYAVPPLAYEVASGVLPAGLTLDPATGAVSGTPTSLGSSTYAIRLTDGVGGKAVSAAATVKVIAALGATQPNLYVRATVPYAGKPLVVTPSPVTPLSATLLGGGAIDGLGVDPLTGALVGTPTNLAFAAGAKTLQVGGLDADGYAFQTNPFLVTVLANGPITTQRAPTPTYAHQGSPAAVAAPVFGNFAPPLTYSLGGGTLPPGTSVDASTGVIVGTPTQQGDFANVKVKAVDQTQATATSSAFTVTVLPPLAVGDVSSSHGRVGVQQMQVQAPDVSGNPILPLSWKVATSVPAAADGTKVALSPLPTGLSVDPHGGFVSGQPTMAGTYVLALTVTDAANGVATTKPFTVTVNAPLTMANGGTFVARQDVPTSVPAPAVGNDPTPPVYWTSPATIPQGFDLDPNTGILSGTSGVGLTGTTFSLPLTATDDEGAAADDSANPAVIAFYPPLSFGPVAGGQAHVGSPATFPAPPVGGTPVDPLVVTVAPALPAGLVAATDGSISGTPTAASPTATYAFSASDATGGVVGPQPFPITVLPRLALSIADASGIVTLKGTQVPAPTLVGSPVAPTKWTVTSGSLPAGLALDPATGAVSGTPTTPGTSTLAVTAADSAQGTVTSAPFKIAVTPAPAIAPYALEVTAGKASTNDLRTLMAAANFTSPSPAWTSTALPAGLALSGAGTLSGTATAADVRSVTVSATDSNGLVATAALSLTVGLQPTIVATTKYVPLGLPATLDLSKVMGATNLLNPTWTVTGLDPAFSLSAAGVLTGTAATKGVTTATVTVANATGESATAALSLDGEIAPTLAPGSYQDYQGRGVSQSMSSLMATTRTEGPTWSAANLPAGLTLAPDGSLGGAATASGVTPVAVTVTNGNGLSATATLSLTILRAPLPSLSTGLVGVWNFDEGKGTSTADLSGLGNTLTSSPSSTALWTTQGLSRGGAQMDGSHIFATAGAAITTQARSMSLWFKTTTANGGLMSSGQSGYNVEGFSLNGGAIGFGLGYYPNSCGVTAPGNFADGKWHLATITYDQSRLVGYVDGVVGASVACSTSTMVSPTQVGGYYSSGFASGYLTGSLDQAGAWSRALNADEVADLYNLGFGNGPLSVGTPGTAVAHVGSPATLPSVASSGFVTPTYAVASGALPAGLALDPATGAIAGTPTAVASGPVAVSVTDYNGSSKTTGAFTVTTLAALAATTPTTTQVLALNATSTVAAPSVSNGYGTLAVTLASGGIPPGMTLSPTTGALSGKPTTAGAYAYTLTVTDGTVNGVATTGAFNVSVHAPPTLVSGTATSRMGQYFSGDAGTLLKATNVDPGSVGWGATAPAWLNVGQNGGLYGLPPAAGSYAIPFTVSNADGLSATATLTLLVQAQPLASLANGLVAFWSFDDAAGSTATDATGNYPLTLTSSGLWSTPGLIGGDVSITGSNSGSNAAFAGQLTGASPRTMSAWFKTTSTGTVSLMLWGAYNNSALSQLVMYNGGILRFGAYYNDLDTPNGNYADGKWHLATATYDGTRRTIYVDGVQRATDTTGLGTGSGPVTVGQMTGEIDEAGLWNRALTQAEVTNLYDFGAGNTPFVASASGFTAHAAPLTSAPVKVGGRYSKPLVFSLASGALPAGLSVDPGTGSLTGTPTATGTSTLAIAVNDANGAPAVTPTFSVTIVAPLAGTPTPTTAVAVAKASTVPGPTVTNAAGTLAYALASGTVPTGMTLSSTTGGLSGTPTAQGSFTYALSVSDGTIGGSLTLGSTTVNVDAPPTLTAATRTIAVGKAASLDASAALAATGLSSPTFTQTGLPATLSISAAGLVTGTPTATGTVVGAVTATNADGLSATANLTLVVATPPQLSAAADSAYSSATYRGNLATLLGATGLSTPTWTQTGLPAGLTLAASTGLVTGSVATSGTYPVTVTVTNPNGLSSTAQLTLTVATPTLLTALVGYWAFEDQSGASASDATGAFPLAFGGTPPTWTTSGEVAGGIALTGAGYARSSASSPITGSKPFTLAGWFKTSSATLQGILTTGTGSAGQMASLEVSAAGAPSLNFYGGGYQLVSSTAGFSDGRWHFAAGTYDGATATIYVDGVARGTLAATPNVLAAPFSVGGQANATGYMTGSVDEVGAWGRALSASEVATLYNSGSGGTFPFTVGAPTLSPGTATAPAGTTVSLKTAMPLSGGYEPVWTIPGAPSGYAVDARTGVLTVPVSAAAGTVTINVTATNFGGQASTAQLTLTVTGLTLSSGLVAYWPFSEGSGSTAADATGTYPLSGVSGWTATGEVGSAANFTGTSSAAGGSFGAITGAAPRTLSTWFRRSTANSADSLLVNFGVLSSNGLSGIGINSANNIGYIGYSNDLTSVSATPYEDGNWHLATVTYDGSNMVFYLDGASKATATKTLATGTGSLVVGGLVGGGQLSTTAQDEVGIWSRALSATEVASLYNSGVGSTAPFTQTTPTLAPATVTANVGATVQLATVMSLGNGNLPVWSASGTPSGTTLDPKTGILTVGGATGTYPIQVKATNFGGASSTATLTLTTKVDASSLQGGLLSFWKLDETSGATSADLVGGRTLTLVGSPSRTSGVSGNAVTFSGSNNANASWGLLTGNVPRSTSAWFKTTTGGNALGLMSMGTVQTAYQGFTLCLNTPTAVGFCGSGNDVSFPATYADGQWHMLTNTWDGTTMSVYFDGAKIGTKALLAMQTPSSNVWLGSNAGSTYYFNGTLDEAGVWNRALSASEVATLYAVKGMSAALKAGTATVTVGTGNSVDLATAMSGTASAPATWAATGLPSWATLSSAGVLTGTPTSAGSITASVTLTGSDNETLTATLTIAAVAAPTPSNGMTTGSIGLPYSGSLATITGVAGLSAPTWTATGLPAGVTLSDASAGTLSGTPTTLGTSTVTVTVVNGGGAVPVSAQVTFVVSPPDTTSLRSGLLALWRFDEGTGTTSSDPAGGHTLTLGSGQSWSTGISGGAVASTGASWATATWNLLPGAAPRTQSLWFKTTSNAFQIPMELSTGGGYTDQTSLCMTAGKLGFCPGGPYGATTYAATYADGNWHLLTATYDGSTMTTYFDGAPLGSSTLALTANNVTTAYLGGSGTNGYSLVGSMDEAAVWGRALSAAEVRTLYAAKTPAPGLSAATLSLPPGSPASASLPTTMSATLTSGATWTATNLPTWATLSTAGTLTGTPTTGTTVVPVTVTNANGQSSTANLTIVASSSNLTQGQVAYWKFDEAGGTVATDAVAGAYPLTVNGTLGDQGRIGYAASFSGATNQYAYNSGAWASSTPVTGAAARTQSAWFKTTVASQALLSWGQGGGAVSELQVDASGHVAFYNGSTTVAGTTTGLNDGNWHLGTVTYDGATVRVYADGALQGTSALTLATGSSNLGVGTRTGSSLYFNGAIDEAGVWSRALSAAEVGALYGNGNGTQPNSSVNLASGQMAFLKFNEGAGSTTADSVGSANGTWSAGAAWSTGVLGTAGTFSGSNYMTLSASPALQQQQFPLTVAGWVNVSSTSGARHVYGAYSAADNTHLSSILRVQDGYLLFIGSTASGQYYQQTFGPAVSANAWHFVAVTVSGSASAPTVTLKVDGTQSTSTFAPLGTLATSVPVTLAGNPSTGGYLAGSIDELGVWNRALNAAELQALYLSKSPTNAPAISAGASSAVLGQATSTPLATVMGVTASAVTSWQVSGGALPTGLSLDPSSGTLSGTPTGATGAYSAQVLVTGPNGASASAALKVTVGASTLVNGLVSYARFDEGAGTSFADTASGSTGTLQVQGTATAPTWASVGRVNKGLTFAAPTSTSSGGEADVPFGKLVGNVAMTMSVWERTSVNASGKFMSFGTYAGTNGMISELGFNGGNVGYWGNANDCSAGGSGGYADGNWHMVTATYSPGTLKVYLDGALKASCGLTLNNGSSNVFYGRSASTRADIGNLYWQGTVDEGAVWNRALTDAEVTKLYNGGAGLQDSGF